MTTIGKSMFPLKTSFQLLTGMKQRYDHLQGQLASGQKAATLAEMGSTRFFNLSMRTRISGLESYAQTMGTVGLRLSVLDTSLSRLDAIESEQRISATPGGAGTHNVNFATLPETSRARLDEVLDLLNTNIGGRYLFSGGTADRKPVLSAETLLHGAGGRAGFSTILEQRVAADTGDGMGRLTLSAAGNTVTLAEDGAHPFGLKLSTVSSSSVDVTGAIAAGPPDALEVQFGAVPAVGTKLTIGFTLPDGTEEQVVLTGVSGTPAAGEFQLGANASDTAANLEAALDTAVSRLVATKGAAASAFAASDNFFNGRGEDVMRVDGPPYDTATALIAATEADTVLWYSGEDSTDPRGSVTARVDDGTSVRYGVQGNEAGLVGLVRSLAVMATATFSNGDDTSLARFDAMAGRQIERLSAAHTNQAGSIKVIAVELGMAKTTMANVGERHQSHKAQLETMLTDLESAPMEEVAMEILALKTRLEASYQATAMVAQLSFVNYMR